MEINKISMGTVISGDIKAVRVTNELEEGASIKTSIRNSAIARE